MAGLKIHQSCWNHEAREAVCRCPECGRSFCRECVTEHAARLLCAACLRKVMLATRPKQAGGRLRQVGILAGGLFLSWVIFLVVAGGVSEFSARIEQAAWQNR